MADMEQSSDEFEDIEEEMEGEEEESTKVYLPKYGVEEDEELVCDKSAYLMYHHGNAGSPCLSFDIILDENQTSDQYPATIYGVTGSQAESSRGNHVIAMKMSNLHGVIQKDKNEVNSDSEDEDSSDEEDGDREKQPVFESTMRQHRGGVNRVRYTTFQGKPLVATWGENASVNIWNMKDQMNALKNKSAMAKYKQNKQLKSAPPVFTFAGYMTEGFAMDWSKVNKGSLLTGDCKNKIFLLAPTEGGWSVDQKPFSGHEGSVEEVLWSPNEATVFASCSADASIRIWDTRSKSNQMKIGKAHDSDVNVMSWNSSDPFIVSGGDDGMIKIWDLRQLAKSSKAVATFKHHSAPITSVEWNPNDKSVFAAAGADDQITIWDLGVEKDEEEEAKNKDESNIAEVSDVPPQLLFIHQGQKDIKELHWHKQYPGLIVSTALDGFNIFRTVSV